MHHSNKDRNQKDRPGKKKKAKYSAHNGAVGRRSFLFVFLGAVLGLNALDLGLELLDGVGQGAVLVEIDALLDVLLALAAAGREAGERLVRVVLARHEVEKVAEDAGACASTWSENSSRHKWVTMERTWHKMAEQDTIDSKIHQNTHKMHQNGTKTHKIRYANSILVAATDLRTEREKVGDRFHDVPRVVKPRQAHHEAPLGAEPGKPEPHKPIIILRGIASEHRSTTAWHRQKRRTLLALVSHATLTFSIASNCAFNSASSSRRCWRRSSSVGIWMVSSLPAWCPSGVHLQRDQRKKQEKMIKRRLP